MSVFNDLWSSKFVPSIQWIYDEKITNGCTDTRFCPVSPVTRGQMASFLARTMDSAGCHEGLLQRRQRPDPRGRHQPDRGGRASPVAAQPGRFCRLASVTRAQMAAFLGRALDLPAATKDYFTDDNGHTRSKRAINAMAEAGLTGGCAATKFCPSAAVTREQMAAFLLRAFKPD